MAQLLVGTDGKTTGFYTGNVPKGMEFRLVTPVQKMGDCKLPMEYVCEHCDRLVCYRHWDVLRRCCDTCSPTANIVWKGLLRRIVSYLRDPGYKNKTICQL